ncbi:MAG TPA: alpha/beta hydrolase, partial [Homoserinimonas sp.]|nr:alpha/beta hydrolase [Homoserinimonas sp.]
GKGRWRTVEPRVLIHDERGVGEPVVLIPGGLTGWLSWMPHQERLADRYRAIRVQPIHNELGSAGVPGDLEYTVEIERESLRLTLDALGLDDAHLAGWSGGGKAALEFAIQYPDRVRSLTLVEPAAYWILEKLGDSPQEVERINSLVHGLFGRQVTEGDLADFLELAGFVESASDAPSHPNWNRWLTHRMALSWQGEQLDHPDRTVEDVARIDCPTLLTKGTRTSDWLKRVVDVLGERMTDATVVEFEGDHAHHIQSMDAFLEALEAHLSLVDSSPR